MNLFSGRDDQRVFEAGRRYFSTAFPNPNRVGCPGTELLRDIAFRKADRSTAKQWHTHLMQCSPCFVEYVAFRDQARREWRPKTLSKAPLPFARRSSSGVLAGLTQTPPLARARDSVPAQHDSTNASEVRSNLVWMKCARRTARGRRETNVEGDGVGIIFSRKGFDERNGGIASPILRKMGPPDEYPEPASIEDPVV